MAKRTASFKIDITVLEIFNKRAKENAINKSQWIENKMAEYLRDNKGE